MENKNFNWDILDDINGFYNYNTDEYLSALQTIEILKLLGFTCGIRNDNIGAWVTLNDKVHYTKSENLESFIGKWIDIHLFIKVLDNAQFSYTHHEDKKLIILDLEQSGNISINLLDSIFSSGLTTKLKGYHLLTYLSDSVEWVEN